MSKKLVFVSNYFNHHQKALADAFVRIYGEDYAFIAMTPFNEKRLAIGYKDMNQTSYVLRAYESPGALEEARRMILESECVIAGGMPVSVVSERLRQGKITFMQSERFFKGPFWKDAVRFAKYWRYSGGRVYARDPLAKFYLLCASAYAAWDYNTCGLFKGKAYRWGYFPELKQYDEIPGKVRGRIIWVGRFLDWKHPDLAVKMAARLKAQHKSFSMKIIGSGEMQEELTRMIDAENVADCVELTGALPVEEVRGEMERAEIFLFTSDRGEGWGVVLNEAMNSWCAVAASWQSGSSPYLVRNGRNGIIFRGLDALTENVSELLDDEAMCAELGRNAYRNMLDVWSAEVAANRFVELAEALKGSDGAVRLWEDGPCSVAPVI
ncbi:MAG: glycosyltransferase [Synergistaceae bacterium]|nr:glycosyltransferase [Synergistaceae bacterium]